MLDTSGPFSPQFHMLRQSPLTSSKQHIGPEHLLQLNTGIRPRILDADLFEKAVSFSLKLISHHLATNNPTPLTDSVPKSKYEEPTLSLPRPHLYQVPAPNTLPL